MSVPKNLCPGCMSDMSGASSCPSCGWDGTSSADNPLYLPPGYLLNNRYTIGKVLGMGGFGIVYIAWDNNLDVRAAIKEFLPKEYAARSSNHVNITAYTGNASEEFSLGVEKFLEEAKALARFQDHPGIVTVHESFRANNTAYMVMQYLDGMTMKEYLKRQPGEKISFNVAVKAMTPIMDALREVHNAGFVHRDISPDNIFFTNNNQVKLLDFGSARYAIGEHSKSLTSVLKHGYAPVEQYSVKGRQGPWSDVYAVCATLYRCVTGIVPPDAMERMQGDSLHSPRNLGIEIPQSGERAIMRGMALKATDRFENIQQLQQALGIGTITEQQRGQEKVIQSPAKDYIQKQEYDSSQQYKREEVNINAKRVTKHPFKRVNPHNFTITVWGGLIFLILGAIADKPWDGFLILVGLSSIGYGYIYSLRILYKCWQVLQGFTARTTAGKAVGFLFIPIYNIYWMFVSLKGLASDANYFLKQRRMNDKINEGLSTTTCVFNIIPYLNFISIIFINILVYQWADFYNTVVSNWDELSTMPVLDWERKPGSGNTAAVAIASVVGAIVIIGILAAIAIPQFIQYRKRGYVSTLNTDCKNAYTASVAFTVDHPSAQNITLSQLQDAGYSQTAGVTTTPYYLSDTSGIITCSGPSTWGVSEAFVTVDSDGRMTLTPSRIGESTGPSPAEAPRVEAPVAPAPAPDTWVEAPVAPAPAPRVEAPVAPAPVYEAAPAEAPRVEAPVAPAPGPAPEAASVGSHVALMPKYQSQQNSLDTSSLSIGEKSALFNACYNAQQQGPAAYNQCVRQELSKMDSNRPDTSSLSIGEKSALFNACYNAQQQGPAAYNQCVRQELSKMGIR